MGKRLKVKRSVKTVIQATILTEHTKEKRLFNAKMPLVF
jgi:hypothetical protein